MKVKATLWACTLARSVNSSGTEEALTKSRCVATTPRTYSRFDGSVSNLRRTRLKVAVDPLASHYMIECFCLHIDFVCYSCVTMRILLRHVAADMAKSRIPAALPPKT